MRVRVAILITAAIMAGGRARAAEHITLKNGFELICDHREPNGNHVRLYTTATNFIEVRADEITSIEPAPDLPVERATRSSAATPADIPALTAQAGTRHNIDVDLLASVIRAESGGNPRAVSHAGAAGLMQLMPSTAQQLGVEDRFHPEQNINGGTAYLDALLTRYHDNLPLALAAYNAGPAAVDKYHGIPPYRETRAYVARVIREFNRRVMARQAASTATVSTGVTKQGPAPTQEVAKSKEQ
jgi:soluble lytic murein transglycosylase-like protein